MGIPHSCSTCAPGNTIPPMDASFPFTLLFQRPIDIVKLIFFRKGAIYGDFGNQTNRAIILDDNFQQVTLVQLCLPAGGSRQGNLSIASDLQVFRHGSLAFFKSDFLSYQILQQGRDDVNFAEIGKKSARKHTISDLALFFSWAEPSFEGFLDCPLGIG
ncbi:MAG: hypothetical protein Q8M03_05655 [Legionella sp.]|nr:hypothetical protein [Legionella sp.]